MTLDISRPLCAAFERSAEHYDLVHGGKPYDHEFEYLRHRLGLGLNHRNCLPKILDLGCGTGEFTRRLAPLASHVIGVDPSEPMLREAAGKTQQLSVTLYRGDVFSIPGLEQSRNPHNPGPPYDAACSMFGAMSYATVATSLRETLSRLRSYLAYGSPLVFDVVNLLCCAAALKAESRDAFGPAGERKLLLHRRMTKSLDPLTNLLKIRLEFTESRDGQTVDQWDELHVMRAFTPHEVLADMRAAGFGNLDISVPPHQSHYSNDAMPVGPGDYYFWVSGRAV